MSGLTQLAQSGTVWAMHGEARRWHTLEGDEQAREVVAIVDALYQADQGRRSSYARWLGLYEGQRLAGLTPDAYREPGAIEDRLYNPTRSGVDTMHAEIAGQQRPKPQMMTSGADWQTRRKAKKLDRFLEATLSQPQGRYADTWELWADILLDELVYGVGVGHVAAVDDRVCVERVHPWELLVDPDEARCGTVRNLFRVIDMDVDKALAIFAADEDDEERARIRYALEAEPSPDTGRLGTQRVVETVRIREAIVLPLGDAPGRRVYAVSGGVLYSEEYTRPRFPYLVLRWAPHRIGHWATGLVAEGEALDEELNRVANAMSDRVRLLSTNRIYYQAGSIDEEHLEANDAEVHIPYMQGAQPPSVQQVPPFTPAEAQYEATIHGRYYQQTGVSQQAASSRKEPGIDSGAAIRAMNSLHSARFRLKARAYEQSFVSLGRAIIDTVREVAAENPGFAVQWKGSGFLSEIRWADVDLAEDQYEVSVAAASMLSNDPAGRLQMVQELFGAGIISPPAFQRLLGWPDLEDTMQGETAEQDYIEYLLDRYLDAEDDAELEEAGGYVPPEGFLIDKQGALMQVARAYFQAARDGAPEYSLGLLRRYIQQLDRLLAPPAPTPLPPGAPGPAPAIAAGPGAASVPPGLPPAPPPQPMMQ